MISPGVLGQRVMILEGQLWGHSDSGGFLRREGLADYILMDGIGGGVGRMVKGHRYYTLYFVWIWTMAEEALGGCGGRGRGRGGGRGRGRGRGGERGGRVSRLECSRWKTLDVDRTISGISFVGWHVISAYKMADTTARGFHGHSRFCFFLQRAKGHAGVDKMASRSDSNLSRSPVFAPMV